MLTRGAAPPLARGDAAAVAAWRSAASAGAPVRTLATPRGALVSRDASGRAVPGGGVADLGAVFAPGFADARAARDAAVAALVSAAASPSFACGAAPIVDAGCDVSGGGAATWPRGARARPRDNVFVERGLRGAGAASVADWLRNATAALVLTAGGAGPGVTFYDAYDGAGAGAGRRGRNRRGGAKSGGAAKQPPPAGQAPPPAKGQAPPGGGDAGRQRKSRRGRRTGGGGEAKPQ